MASTVTNLKFPTAGLENTIGERTCHLGPFKDDNDNLYAVGEYTGAAGQIDVFKSTDDGATWSRVDTAGHPTAFTDGLFSINTVQVGDTLHVVAMEVWHSAGMGSEYALEYHTFNMSSAGANQDSWVITNEAISTESIGTTSGIANLGIAVRSDGDVIVDYTNTISIMGSGYYRPFYARREGGTWTTGIELTGDSSTEAHILAGRMVMADNDECHIFYHQQFVGCKALTLDSANSTSTPITVLTWDAGAIASARPIYWVNGTTPQIFVVDAGRARRLTEDGNGDIALEAGQGEQLAQDSNSKFPLAGGALFDTSDNEVYMFGGVFGTGYDSDLFIHHSTHGDDADWANSTLEEVEDNVTAPDDFEINAGFYLRGGNPIHGVIWREVSGNTVEYSEHAAGAPQTVNVGVVTETESAQIVLQGLPFRDFPWVTGNHGPWVASDGDLFIITLKDYATPTGELTVWKSPDKGDSWYDIGVTINPPDDVAWSQWPGLNITGNPHPWPFQDGDTLDIFWMRETVASTTWKLGHIQLDMAAETVGSFTDLGAIGYLPQVVKRSNGNFVIGMRETSSKWSIYEGTPAGGFSKIVDGVFPSATGNRDQIGLATQGDIVHVIGNSPT